MSNFKEILESIGAKEISQVKNHDHWTIWKASYQTPIQTITGYYVFLKDNCTLKELETVSSRENWRIISGSNNYTIVTNPKNFLLKHAQQIKKFHPDSEIKITKDILYENLIDIASLKKIKTEEYFIEPDLVFNDEENEKCPAISYLTDWVEKEAKTESDNSIAVMIANAGIGKTTVSRVLSHDLQNNIPPIIPLLVESDQWIGFINSHLTMDEIWNKALTKRFENVGRLLDNTKALKTLINEGIFVIIFDGFDELCAAPDTPFTPQEIITYLKTMINHDDGIVQSKIIITSRSTFWESIKENIDLDSVDVFKLIGFDTKKKQSYFNQRLSNTEERDIAKRISSEISGSVFSTKQGNLIKEEFNKDRLSGAPFILDLISRYVHDYPDASKRKINPYAPDHFSWLLEGICLRENRRQKYDIEPAKQFILFEELFRDHPQGFTYSDLETYLTIFCEKEEQDIVDKFTQHALIAPDGISIDGERLYKPQYDVLQVYFLASYLANRLSGELNSAEKDKIIQILSSNKLGKTQLIDWLVTKLKNYDETKLISALKHAYEITNEDSNNTNKVSSKMAIFHLISSLIVSTDKLERTVSLFSYMGSKLDVTGGITYVTDLVFTGFIKSYTFDNISFERCKFINVEFKNCNFNEQTSFNKCRFDGLLEFNNCKDANCIREIQCDFSDQAEFSFNTAVNMGIRSELKLKFCEEVLYRVFKKFRGELSFGPIMYSNRMGGLNHKNPYSTKIWDILNVEKIIEQHPIPNVKDGGLNIVDNNEIRSEINFFLDNGVMGKRLKSVCNNITEG